jgi:hypothetical protein
MADKWVDPAATGANNGTSPANAWTNLKTALEYGHSAGDRIWVRRTLNQGVTSSRIIPAGTGTAASPIEVIGWPRSTRTGTATFTNGSDTVTSCSLAITLREFGARWIKCGADGHWYLITAYVSASSFKIDRPYAGTTFTASAFTIREDEDYATRPSAGYGWDADSQNLPRAIANSAGYEHIQQSYNYWWFKNINFYRTNTGSFWLLYGYRIAGLGCVFEHSAAYNGSGYGIYPNELNACCHLERFVIGGSIAANTHTAVYVGTSYGQQISLKDGAIHGVGTGILSSYPNPLALENINIGVEVAVPTANISLYGRSNMLVGKDVKLGHTTPANRIVLSTGLGESTLYADFAPFNVINIENYQKDRNQIYRHAGQVYTSKGVDTSTTDPRKRTGGADLVVVADLSTGGMDWGPHYQYAQCSIFDQRIFQLGGSNKSYRIYLQSTVAIPSGKILMEVEFMDSYNSTTLWTENRKTGTAAIPARSGVSDWSQYIEVTGINPPEDCAVRVRLFCSAYSATHYLYIDPKVVVS